MKKINFIGCGRLGKAVAKLIHLNSTGEITGVINSSFESSEKAVEFIGAGMAVKNISELPDADIYFITTPDDLILPTAQNLAESGKLNKDSIVVHCSGSLPASVLDVTDCLAASIHPIKSFADEDEAIKTFKSTYCAAEGNDKAITELSPLFEIIGGIVFPIDNKEKAKYHAALAIANNYTTTLHYLSSTLLKESGIDNETAKKIATMMIQGAINNLNGKEHADALTGPLQRGDVNTIESHIKALEGSNATSETYKQLGVSTLSFINHNPETENHLNRLLRAKL